VQLHATAQHPLKSAKHCSPLLIPAVPKRSTRWRRARRSGSGTWARRRRQPTQRWAAPRAPTGWRSRRRAARCSPSRRRPCSEHQVGSLCPINSSLALAGHSVRFAERPCGRTTQLPLLLAFSDSVHRRLYSSTRNGARSTQGWLRCLHRLQAQLQEEAPGRVAEATALAADATDRALNAEAAALAASEPADVPAVQVLPASCFHGDRL
jgi:hypothetical protein